MKLVEQLEKLSADRKAQAAATYRTILLRSGEPQAADDTAPAVLPSHNDSVDLEVTDGYGDAIEDFLTLVL